MAQQSIDAMKLALTQHGMYSPLEKATMGVNRTKGTPAEFMAEASKQPGFRKEEVVDRKLQLPDQKLTKPEFMAHLKKSPMPKVTEHELHDFGDEEDALQAASQAIYGQNYDEVYDDRQAREKVEDWVKKHTAKYQDYQLPGGKNYREVLLQTPHFSEMDQNRLMELEADRRRSPQPKFWGMDTGANKELADLEKRKASMGEQYHTSHWEGHPNVIAHMRMSDRTGPNKEKLLHIEEIQSDLHQEGRKKGYRVNGESMPPEKAKRMTDKIMERFNAGELTTTQRNELLEKLDAAIENNNKVPDMPFKKNWHELAIKHALHHAAKHGYHGVVITPGQEQAERYPRRDESEKVAQEKGMKGFYDKIVPDYLNNIGKKYGVKTQLHAYPIETGREQMIPDNAGLGMIRSGNSEYAQAHHFPITEPMRQQILQGQPMYKQGGIIHKAEGGNVQPSIAQMRMALQQGNPIAAQNIGVEEAPNMSPKMYFSPSQNEDDTPNTGNSFDQDGVPVGGVDENILQPGTQFIAQSQQQPGQPPQGAQSGFPMQPPQGGAPTGPQGPTPPMGNMLSMTPQGQAMQAMGPKGPPSAPGTQPQPGTQPTPGMARGGNVSGYAKEKLVKNKKKVGKVTLAPTQDTMRLALTKKKAK